MKTRRQISAKGGSAVRLCAAKARTSERARAAEQARWAKSQPKSEKPNVQDEPASPNAK